MFWAKAGGLVTLHKTPFCGKENTVLHLVTHSFSQGK